MQRAVIIKTLVVFVLMAFFYCPAGAQTPIEECEKTITLQNGDIVLDMSGEWDALTEGQGPYSGLRPTENVLIVNQKNNQFTAIKKTGAGVIPKGQAVIRGKLCKDGFEDTEMKRALQGANMQWVPCNWSVLDNGNKIVFDDGRTLKSTITRR